MKLIAKTKIKGAKQSYDCHKMKHKGKRKRERPVQIYGRVSFDSHKLIKRIFTKKKKNQCPPFLTFGGISEI